MQFEVIPHETCILGLKSSHIQLFYYTTICFGFHFFVIKIQIQISKICPRGTFLR